ncbi:hypothetical protein GQ607_002252 [Colletotrichum asianum]|uniref:Uncharacterized protein n=1 Tax=Colletotrichum asianum TaxID=702518 RepID=A0A8H3WLR5_9PEZI|nr:hypothetical protein GQ607_002252 [Colletotrichum asianum]
MEKAPRVSLLEAGALCLACQRRRKV